MAVEEREGARRRWRRPGGFAVDRPALDLDLDQGGHLEGVRCGRLRNPWCTAPRPGFKAGAVPSGLLLAAPSQPTVFSALVAFLTRTATAVPLVAVQVPC